MRIRIALTTLLVVIVAACSGGSSATNPPGAAGSAAASQTAAASAPAGNGKVDCTAIKAAAVHLLDIQLLAQLTTPDAVASIKAKEIGNYDPDAFLAALHTLHALDGYGGPLGDPKAAIDFYETAGQAAKVLFATDPMTQAAIDTYNKNVGSIGDFLGHQTAIAGAMSTAGC